MEAVTPFTPQGTLITPERKPSQNEIFGVPLLPTSTVRFYATVFYHVAGIDHPGDFPLAHLDDPTMTNCDFGAVLVVDGDAETIGSRFRYYHKDSTSPFDGLDKKHWFTGTARTGTLTLDRFKEVLSELHRIYGGFTEPSFLLVDDGTLPNVERFVQAVQSLPFAHTEAVSPLEKQRVVAPAGAVKVF